MAKKSHLKFDPSELDDLILTPAVGTGVGSHLVNQYKKTTQVIQKQPTMVIINETTVGTMWITEAGDVLPSSRIKQIRLLEDILNATEKAVYETLWNHLGAVPQDYSRLVQAGYQYLMDTTGLSKKTIQRVIDRLIIKDFIARERPADIYERQPTIYRVFGFPQVLTRLEEQGRLHAARIGPGVVYARPLAVDFNRRPAPDISPGTRHVD
jgi:hypothetical protein